MLSHAFTVIRHLQLVVCAWRIRAALRVCALFTLPPEFLVVEIVDDPVSGCIMRGSADETSVGFIEFFDSVRR